VYGISPIPKGIKYPRIPKGIKYPRVSYSGRVSGSWLENLTTGSMLRLKNAQISQDFDYRYERSTTQPQHS